MVSATTAGATASAGLRWLVLARRELLVALPFLFAGAALVLLPPSVAARLLRGLPFLFSVTDGREAVLRLRLVDGAAELEGSAGAMLVVSAES